MHVLQIGGYTEDDINMRLVTFTHLCVCVPQYSSFGSGNGPKQFGRLGSADRRTCLSFGPATRMSGTPHALTPTRWAARLENSYWHTEPPCQAGDVVCLATSSPAVCLAEEE